MKRGISTSTHGNIWVARCGTALVSYVLKEVSVGMFQSSIGLTVGPIKLLRAKITLRHKPLVAQQQVRRHFAGYK